MKMLRAIILLFFFPLITSAQPNDSLRLDTIKHAFPEAVFVMAPKSKNLFSVSSITSRDISLQATPVIEPMINQHAGIWMQSAGLNTNRISIRGVGYREPFATTGVKVYLDEIPVTSGVGESSIEDIHPELFSAIELWRGPSSAIWGSGLGGMIHLQLQKPLTDELKTSVQIGSFGRTQFDQSFQFTYGSTEQLATTLHYQFLQDDGFRENNAYDRHSATLIQHWEAGNLHLKALLHGISLKAFIPSSLHADHFNVSPRIAAPNWAAVSGNEDYLKWISGISAKYVFGPDLLHQGTLFYTGFQSDEIRPFNVLHESSHSAGTRQKLIWSIQPRISLSAGLEYFRERYAASFFETLPGGEVGSFIEDAQHDYQYFHSFFQFEGSMSKRWRYFAGVSTADFHVENEMHEINSALKWYPTAGISYKINDAWQTSLSLSRGYSPFGIDDILDSEGDINNDVQPEHGWSKEAGLNYQSEYFQAKLTAYDMVVDRTIITRRLTEDTFERINGGGSHHQGLELEYHVKVFAQKWHWKGSYTFQHNTFRDFIDNGQVLSGLKLPGTPDNRFYNQLAWFADEKFFIMLEHHWVDKVFLNDANTLQSDSYHLLHAGMGYAFEVSENVSLDLNARVHNLLDAHYASMFQINALAASGSLPRYYYPGKPRSLYFKVGVRFHLQKK